MGAKRTTPDEIAKLQALEERQRLRKEADTQKLQALERLHRAGMTAKQMAKTLRFSERKVKEHLDRIKQRVE